MTLGKVCIQREHRYFFYVWRSACILYKCSACTAINVCCLFKIGKYLVKGLPVVKLDGYVYYIFHDINLLSVYTDKNYYLVTLFSSPIVI